MTKKREILCTLPDLPGASIEMRIGCCLREVRFFAETKLIDPIRFRTYTMLLLRIDRKYLVIPGHFLVL